MSIHSSNPFRRSEALEQSLFSDSLCPGRRARALSTRKFLLQRADCHPLFNSKSQRHPWGFRGTMRTICEPFLGAQHIERPGVSNGNVTVGGCRLFPRGPSPRAQAAPENRGAAMHKENIGYLGKLPAKKPEGRIRSEEPAEPGAAREPRKRRSGHGSQRHGGSLDPTSTGEPLAQNPGR